jgi:hypothetical protein
LKTKWTSIKALSDLNMEKDYWNIINFYKILIIESL